MKLSFLSPLEIQTSDELLEPHRTHSSRQLCGDVLYKISSYLSDIIDVRLFLKIVQESHCRQPTRNGNFPVPELLIGFLYALPLLENSESNLTKQPSIERVASRDGALETKEFSSSAVDSSQATGTVPQDSREAGGVLSRTARVLTLVVDEERINRRVWRHHRRDSGLTTTEQVGRVRPVGPTEVAAFHAMVQKGLRLALQLAQAGKRQNIVIKLKVLGAPGCSRITFRTLKPFLVEAGDLLVELSIVSQDLLLPVRRMDPHIAQETPEGDKKVDNYEVHVCTATSPLGYKAYNDTKNEWCTGRRLEDSNVWHDSDTWLALPGLPVLRNLSIIGPSSRLWFGAMRDIICVSLTELTLQLWLPTEATGEPPDRVLEQNLAEFLVSVCAHSDLSVLRVIMPPSSLSSPNLAARVFYILQAKQWLINKLIFVSHVPFTVPSEAPYRPTLLMETLQSHCRDVGRLLRALDCMMTSESASRLRQRDSPLEIHWALSPKLDRPVVEEDMSQLTASIPQGDEKTHLFGTYILRKVKQLESRHLCGKIVHYLPTWFLMQPYLLGETPEEGSPGPGRPGERISLNGFSRGSVQPPARNPRRQRPQR